MKIWLPTLLVLQAVQIRTAEAQDAKPAYEKTCASCHGNDGRGNEKKAQILKIDPKVLNLGREETAKATRDELKKIILDGKGKMPAYSKKLKPEEVEALVDYVGKLAAAIRGTK